MAPAIGMTYDQIRPDERMIIDTAKREGIDLALYNAEDLFAEATNKDDGVQFAPVVLERCIGYFRGLHLAALMESRGVKVINSYQAVSTCGNKLLASLALAREKVATPRTFVAFTEDSALKALDSLGYPAMLKPVVGSWGRLVAMIKDPDSAKAIIEPREFMHPLHQIYYIQEMVDRPGRDIRCFVIGDRAVAAMYRYAPPGDWRTNASRGAHVENCEITSQLEELSVRAAKVFGGGAFGVDLMEGPGGLLVHEVNHTTEFKNTVKATGVDIPKLLIEYAVQQAKR